jgi:pimeloyl-ACP methyl ester carboxylesterase
MEMLRRAFGSLKLNYLGVSYGTQIGLQYVELYPENVSRFVLDAVTDHTLPETATLLAENTTYEAVPSKFFQWCNSTSNCACEGQDFPTIFDTVVTNTSLSQIPALGCQASGACLQTRTFSPMSKAISSQELAASPLPHSGQHSIKEASEGNAKMFSTALATITVTPDGTYARLTVGCQGWLQGIKEPI